VPAFLRQIDFTIQQSRTLHNLFCLIFPQFLNVLSSFHALDQAEFYLHVIYGHVCYIPYLTYSLTLNMEAIYSAKSPFSFSLSLNYTALQPRRVYSL
jgi:hypothetical protein